jgi:hypothetical protein
MYSSVLLLGTVLLYGIRHGLDWDHLAALTDLSGSSEDKRTAFINGSLYALGHAIVVVIFGVVALVLGAKVPEWVDGVMEKVVGITLILLSLSLIYSMIVYKEGFKIRSRWMVLFDLFKKFRHSHEVQEHKTVVGPRGALGIGMIHGVGAETPTQVVLFFTAAGVGGGFYGVVMLIVFVFGLLITNTIILLLALASYGQLSKYKGLYLGLGVLNAAFSLVLGASFLV